jgi:hypothetical protein
MHWRNVMLDMSFTWVNAAVLLVGALAVAMGVSAARH